MTWTELLLLNSQADLLDIDEDDRSGYSLDSPTEFTQDLLGSRGPYFLKYDASGTMYVTFTPHFISMCLVALTDECVNNMIPVESDLWFAYLLYLKDIEDNGTSSLTGTSLLIMETLDARLVAEVDETYVDAEILCTDEII